MTSEHEEYRRRKTEQEAKYKSRFAERWFGWWRNPPDRFAALVAIFTALLFAATLGLWVATNELVRDAKMSGRAWIAPVTARLESPLQADTEAVAIVVTTLNVGKEPALGIVHSGLVDAKPANEIRDRHLCNGLVPQKGQATVYPSDRFGGNFVYGRDFSKDPEAIRDIIAAKRLLYVQGCIAYITVDSPHFSAYCFYLSPETGPQTGSVSPKPVADWRFRACPIGNSAT